MWSICVSCVTICEFFHKDLPRCGGKEAFFCRLTCEVLIVMQWFRLKLSTVVLYLSPHSSQATQIDTKV